MPAVNPSKQAKSGPPMPTLEGEVLGLVLSCLRESHDIIRCAVVSKTWAEASKHTHYSSLSLVSTRVAPGTETQVARAQLRWLQDLQQEGHLDHLQDAALFHDDSEENLMQTSFLSQGFIVLAGTWHLTKVNLTGPLCFATAVAMLPATLVVLRLWPDTGPLTTPLSDFKRFKKLQVLHVGFGLNVGEDDMPNYTFVIDSGFPSLKFLAILDRLRCSILPSYEIGTCLPDMQHLSLKIKVDEAGAQLSENIIALMQLRKLELYLLDGDSDDEVDLVLPAASLIEQLNVVGPPAKLKPVVSLKLNKNGVSYRCANVAEVRVADSDFDLLDSSYLQPYY